MRLGEYPLTERMIELAPASSIVHVLKTYGEVPDGFLGHLLGIQNSKVSEILDALEQRGVVSRKVKGDTTTVTLTSSDAFTE